MSLHSEIALLDARIAELLARVDTGESGALWDALQKEWTQFRLQRNLGDIPKMRVSMAHLDTIMDRAVQDHLAWAEIGEKIEQRRRLVMSESQRMIALQQVLTAEQALALMGVLVRIVTTHIADQEILARIVADVQALLEHEPPGPRPILRGEARNVET